MPVHNRAIGSDPRDEPVGVAALVSVIVYATDATAEDFDRSVRSVMQDSARVDLAKLTIHTVASGQSVQPEEAWAELAARINNALADDAPPFVLLLRAGDELAPAALIQIATAARRQPTATLIYGDYLTRNAQGTLTRVNLPDWSPERFRCHFYMGDTLVINREAALSAGGWNPEAKSAGAFDLVLRLSEGLAEILHLSDPIGSYLSDHDYLLPRLSAEDSTKAVARHCARSRLDWTVSPGTLPGTHHISRRPSSDVTASIIIPTAGRTATMFGETKCMVENAISSIVKHEYSVDYEIVVVYDGSDDVGYLDSLLAIDYNRVRLVRFDRPFNFAEKVNLGALHAENDVLVLFNDDVQVITPTWLDEMCALADVPDVAAVGTKLLYENGVVQHAGMVLKPRPWWIFNSNRRQADDGGILGHLEIDHEVMAVTGAVMAVRRCVYLELGGLSEEFPSDFNDVDFCFKALLLGYRNIVANSVSIYHLESMSREPGSSWLDRTLARGRWSGVFPSDRYLEYVGSNRTNRHYAG